MYEQTVLPTATSNFQLLITCSACKTGCHFQHTYIYNSKHTTSDDSYTPQLLTYMPNVSTQEKVFNKILQFFHTCMQMLT